QPLQSRRPVLRSNTASATGRPPDPRYLDALLRYRARRRRWWWVGAAGTALQSRDARDGHPTQFADPVQPAQLGHFPSRADVGGDDGSGGRFSRAADEEPAGRLQPRLSFRYAPICARRSAADDHLHLCPDRNLSGAGGAVRESARPPGDPRQRADVDVWGADAAVLRPGDNEYLHPSRVGDPDWADQQARYFDGRIRQRAAGSREPRPPTCHRASRPGPATADTDDDGGNGRWAGAIADRNRGGC